MEPVAVSNADPESPLSATRYAALVDPGEGPTELVRGRLVREPRPNLRHGAVQVELAARILAHARETVGGTVLTEAGVILARDPDTVRGPDVAFYSRGRLPRPLPNAFAESPPDLVAEILSPHDPATRIQAKVKDYLEAGVRLVWIVDPEGPTATVYRSPTEIRLLLSEDILDGEDVLPGFQLRLSDLVAG